MINYIVDKNILRDNVNIIKSLAGSTPIIAVLKCNGYGLGLVEFARFLLYRGIEIFAVSAVEEAVTLRKAGITNEIILLSSNAAEDDTEVIVANNIIATIGSLSAAKALDEAGKKLEKLPRAHIEINTGMGRCGFDAADITWAEKLKEKNIEFCGTFTHFSFSFSANESDTLNQFDKFKKTINALRSAGFNTGVVHCANSHAFLKYPQTHMDAVRIGSAFLGRVNDKESFGLKPVGYLESKVVDINFLKKGDNIGYGNTYKAKKDIKTAIVPVGYYHGFMTEKSHDTFRLRDILRYILNDIRSKKTYAEIDGKKYEIIGRIATLNIIIDITGSDIKAGDTVKLAANPILLDSGVKKIYKGNEHI